MILKNVGTKCMGNRKNVLAIVVMVLVATVASTSAFAQDNWDWERDVEGTPCAVPPGPLVTFDEGCPTVAFEEEPGTHDDRPIFIIVYGVCNENDKQTQSDLATRMRQYDGEGTNLVDPTTYPPPDTSYSDFPVTSGSQSGGELAQLVLSQGIIKGEPVFYRIPWSCWTGFNAGAYEVAEQVVEILENEFEAPLISSDWENRQVFFIAHSAGGLVMRTILADYSDPARLAELKLLFNSPGVEEAEPNTDLDDGSVTQFRSWSNQIRERTAGIAIISTPHLGTPLTEITPQRYTKT